MIKLLLKYSLLFACSWTAVIFILCCTPGRFVPTANWLELLSFDKFVHASMFFILTFLWLIVCFRANKLSSITILITILGCVAYGGILEIMQATLFSQRSGDWFDFIANSFGCLIALWVFSKQKFRLNSAI